jgi:hypothetical protein
LQLVLGEGADALPKLALGTDGLPDLPFTGS